MEEKNDNSFRALIGLITYLVGFMLGGSIVMMLVASVYAKSSSYSSNEIIDALNTFTEDSALNKIASGVNVFSNLIIYLLLGGFLIYYLWNFLKEDAIEFRTNKKKYIIEMIIFAAAFYILLFGVDKLIASIVSDKSENQTVIENCFKYKSLAWIMVLVTIFGGPIVEELVFRKCVFKWLSKAPIIVPIIVSAVAFATPHMISTKASLGDWFLLAIPYLFSGFGFSLIYVKCNKNIYVTMFVHFINNLIACLLIIC